MNDFRNMKTIITLIAMMLLLSLIYALLTGCTRTVKSVVEVHDTTYLSHRDSVRHDSLVSRTDTVYKVRTDTVHEYRVFRDSVLVKDSVYVREKGDSVYIYKEKWNTKVVEKTDTIYRSKTDTIYKQRSDTIYINRYVSSADTTRHAVDTNKETVKQKRDWLAWSKWLVPLLFAVGIGWLVWKYVKGR